MSDVQKFLSDPEFHKLPKEARLIVLGKNDPEFASLPPEVQNSVLDQSEKSVSQPIGWPVDPSANDVKPSGGRMDRVMEGAGLHLTNPFNSPTEFAEAIGDPLSFTGKKSMEMGANILKHSGEGLGKYLGLGASELDAGNYGKAAQRGVQGILAGLPVAGEVSQKAFEAGDPTDPDYDPENKYNALGSLGAIVLPEILGSVSSAGKGFAQNRREAIFNNKSLSMANDVTKAGKEFEPGGVLDNAFAWTKKGMLDKINDLVNRQGKDVRKATGANSFLADTLGIKIAPEEAIANLDDLKKSTFTPGDDIVPEPMVHNEDLLNSANKASENVLNAFGGKKGTRSFADVHDMKVKQASEAAKNKYYAQDQSAGIKAQTYGSTASGLRKALNEAASQIQDQFPNAPDYVSANDKYSKLADIQDLFKSGNDTMYNGNTAGKVAASPRYWATRGLVDAVKSNPGMNLGAASGSSIVGRLAASGVPLARAQAMAAFLGQLNGDQNTSN